MGGGYGMGGGMGGGGFCQEQGLNALGLTAEQRSAISAIQSEFSGKQLALADSMRELRGNPDPSTYAARDDLRQQMFELNQQRRERIAAVLTPEQRSQWRPGWRGAPWRG